MMISGGLVDGGPESATARADAEGQSLFIVPDCRGSGLLEQLLDHLRRAAAAAGALDLRLYAHRSNERALRAYRRCGFAEPAYAILAA
jgi:ribosomal protein S18 acetylase RimI-like enzyme